MQVQQTSLSKPQQDSLRRWLDAEAFSVLIEVLESQAFEFEVNAANQHILATTGNDALAADEALKANAIHEQIANLKKIRAMEKFTVATAKPTTTTP